MFKALAESLTRTNLASVKANVAASRVNRSGEVRRTKVSKEVSESQVSKPERAGRGTGESPVVGANKQYVQRGGGETGRTGGLQGGPSVIGGTGKKDRRRGRVDKNSQKGD